MSLKTIFIIFCTTFLISKKNDSVHLQLWRTSVKIGVIHTHPLLFFYSLVYHTSLNCPKVTVVLNSTPQFYDKNNFPEPVIYLCSLALRQNSFVLTCTYRIRDGSNGDDSFSYLKSHLKSAAKSLLCNCSTECSVWTASPLCLSHLYHPLPFKTNYPCCSIKHIGREFFLSITREI